MKTCKISLAVLCATLALGCGAATQNVGSLVLPTSNRTIDIVQHRSDSRGCVELVVLQTYNADGTLVDSAAGRGQTLPCLLTEVIIESGSRVGSAAIMASGMVRAARATRPDNVSIDNVNTQAQGQGQGQAQGQLQGQVNSNVNHNTAKGGAGGSGGNGGSPGQGGGHGNNGGGNGDNDGNNPGTDNHHNNGDNN